MASEKEAEGKKVCSACNGAGRFWQTVAGSLVSGSKVRKCPDCKGTGYRL